MGIQRYDCESGEGMFYNADNGEWVCYEAHNDIVKKLENKIEALAEQLRRGAIRPLACPKCGSASMFKSTLYWNCNSCDESWIEG